MTSGAVRAIFEPMKKLQSVRGMNDIAPPESHTWNFVENIARDISLKAGFGEVRPPVVEPTALFKRGVGEATDVVEKEMYTFEDRNGDSLTLRPECTASVVRACIQHGWTIQQSLLKLFYLGPMFRHERPQKGRYRQFYQYGVELFGVKDPRADAEVIALGWDFLQALGLNGVEIRLSTLGTDEDRGPYIAKISEILESQIDKVPEDFRPRVKTNPLRIFDHKSEEAKEISETLPSFFDYINKENQAHFEDVCAYLDAMSIPYTVDPKIVRGLDYYCLTAFEYVTQGLGQTQNAVGGGGRYDGLFEILGGRPTPGVGFAMGLDRLVLLMADQGELRPQNLQVYVAAQGAEASQKAFSLTRKLRAAGFSAETDLEGRSLKAQFKRAAKLNVGVTLVIGDEELKTGQVQVKDMSQKEQIAVSEGELIGRLAKILQSNPHSPSQ